MQVPRLLACAGNGKVPRQSSMLSAWVLVGLFVRDAVGLNSRCACGLWVVRTNLGIIIGSNRQWRTEVH
jgi:hypothetical protein